MEQTKCQVCKYCDSGNIIKKGTRQNKNSNRQIFKCNDCLKKFTANFGFEKRQFSEETITGGIADILFWNVC